MSSQAIDDYIEDEIDFQYYWMLLLTVLYKYYRYLIVLVILSTAGAYYHVQSAIPTYTASLTLHLADRKRQSWDDSYGGWSSSTIFQQTQVGILNSKRLMTRVVEALKQDRVKLGDEVDELVAESLQGAISIDVAGAREFSNLITISATWTEPQLAAGIANRVAEGYIKLLFDQEIEYALRDQTFLSERTVLLKEDVRIAEQRLQDFREQQNILSSPSGGGELDNELSSMAARFYDAREKRLKLEDLAGQVRNLGGSIEEIKNMPAIANHPRVTSIRDTIFELGKQRSELADRYGPRHIKMIALEAEYRSATSALQQRIEDVVKIIEADYEFALKNEQSLSEALEAVRGRKQSIGRKDYLLKDLQQDVNTKRDVYRKFLALYNQAGARGPTQNNNIWIVDRAVPPEFANTPSLTKNVLLAIVASLFFGTGLGVLLELNRNNIANDRDVESKLGLSLLGAVPLVKSEDQNGEGLGFNEYLNNPDSQFSEAIRSLRTSLTLQSYSQNAHRFMFTSAQPSEGKTTMALSLAESLAQMKKVLMIDCDLRQPSVAGFLGNNEGRTPGLAEVLTNGTAVEDCVVHHDASNVNFLCAGSRTPNPLELLSSPEFTNLLNKLSEDYEMIIFDTPPCLAVSDAYVIASQVDSIIFVIKADDTKIPAIRRSVSRFRSLSTKIPSVILNKVNFESWTNYEYYYSSGYGK